jgi:hypothetical protein
MQVANCLHFYVCHGLIGSRKTGDAGKTSMLERKWTSVIRLQKKV